MDYETKDLLIREVEGVTIVRIRTPNITGIMEVQRMTAEIHSLLDRGVRRMILDFKYVRFAGSATLGMLIELQKKLNISEGKMVLSHAENIEELLAVSRTKSLFTLSPDPKKAFAFFS